MQPSVSVFWFEPEIALRIKAKNRNDVMLAKFSQRFLGSICRQKKTKIASASSETAVKKGSTIQITVGGETARMTQNTRQVAIRNIFHQISKARKRKRINDSVGKRLRKCENWESQEISACACGRGFSIKNIKKDTSICSNYFIGGCSPTEEDPDPLLATLTDKELNKKANRKRKPPKQQERISPKAKKRKSENIDGLFRSSFFMF